MDLVWTQNKQINFATKSWMSVAAGVRDAWFCEEWIRSWFSDVWTKTVPWNRRSRWGKPRASASGRSCEPLNCDPERAAVFGSRSLRPSSRARSSPRRGTWQSPRCGWRWPGPGAPACPSCRHPCTRSDTARLTTPTVLPRNPEDRFDKFKWYICNSFLRWELGREEEAKRESI